jgi:hypothetical protein
VNGWRKATSYDVLYEYRYVDSDDADSLITAIPVTTDPERAGSPDREQQTVTDEMVRWDNEAAPELVLRGPAAISRISALVFEPGPTFGGTVVVRRADGRSGTVTHLPDLTAFLDATTGDAPVTTNADVSLAPDDFLTALGAAGTGIELGDWDTDGATDAYTGFDRLLDATISLPAWTDVLSISYSGPATGLDQTGVVYLRVNAP